MPYVSVATRFQVGDPQSLTRRSPVLISLDALSQLNSDGPLTRRLSSFRLPQPTKYDLQKYQCRRAAHTPPRPTQKPLKSSLKCTRGRRHPPTHPLAGNSPRPCPKSVRFKDKDGELESICLFRSTGRPSSISHPRPHSDTETETDTDSALSPQRGSNVNGKTLYKATEISPVPSPHTPPESNIHLESIALLPVRPTLLRGIVRVRNVAFEKTVVARFTTDGWTTVSETEARYVSPVPGADAGAWDMFAFTIPLEAPHTLLLAVRYTVPNAGEWWDNNGGADFRVVLAPASSPRQPPRAPHVPGPTPGFGFGGVSTTTLPRRRLVGACRTNMASSKRPTFSQYSLPVSPATGQWLRVL